MAGANPIVVVLLLLALVLVGTLVLALRHRLAFRIALRNVRRGRGRTVLLIAGLLVATVIVTGSLLVGDTVGQLIYHYDYIGAGFDDEAITLLSPTGGHAYYPYSTYTQIAGRLAGDPSIAGLTPEIVTSASVYDRASGIPDTDLNLIGVNWNQSGALGDFVADNGTSIAGPAPGEVLLDDQMAAAIDASVGDPLVIYGVTAVPVTVEAIVQENVRGAFITAGLSAGNLFVTLATAQAIENVPAEINYLVVTNSGSEAAGAGASTSMSAILNTTLATIPAAHGLTVSTPLENAIRAGSTSATDLSTLFLALGLFSILAGAMLIIGIFVMLAEERKGEMGLLRAIGLRRRELVYTYYFEGVMYSVGSALAGVVLGVAVGGLLVYLAGFVLSSSGIPENAILQSFTITSRSLVEAYVAGFFLTLITVVAASARASRLNIVRAIRSIPEPPPKVRTYSALAVVGAFLVVVGLLGFRATYQGTDDIAYPIITGGIVIFGAGLVAARFAKNRYVFSAVGAALALWTGVEPLHTFLFGSAHSGTIFNLFVEGILLVGGVLLLVLMNADLLARGLRRLAGNRGQSSPVVRIGTDYPARQPTRTAVSLTIFALVVFTMIATATAGASLQASLSDTVQTESGGYTFFGVSKLPMADLWSEISANATLAPSFSNAVPLLYGEIDVNVSGYAANPTPDALYAPPTNATGPADFYSTNHFTFQSTLHGMSAASAFHEIATNASDAIVDESYAHLANPFSTSSGGHPTLNVGSRILITTRDGGHPTNLTVVGILSESALSGVWVNPSTALALGYENESGYLMTVAPGVSVTVASQDALRAFFPQGLVLFNIEALLATSVQTTEGFIGLLEIFVGLGLGVGIAAMGIFALRAVVERRRQIGMLRAMGFTRGMVLRSFLLEYSFVTLLGIALGTGLGMLTIYNVTISPSATSEGLQVFLVPWLTVVEVAAIAYLLVLVAISAPSLRASHLPPAEAVRSTE
jgi:putative ABC transport system permease protein